MDINERLAQILDRTGDFRILRRVRPAEFTAMSDADRRRAGLSTGIVLDTDTTGLGPRDESIELGMTSFGYDPVTLEVDHVVAAFCALRQPSRPIPPEVTRLTGISERDVRGQAIDPAAGARFVAGAMVVVAHDAAFDRPVCERTWPVFATLPWACSLRQIDWRGEGFEAAKLGGPLAERRLFHDGHRALDDVVALLHLLHQAPVLGRTGFPDMMGTAAAATVRVWAVAAPFGRKDGLKARGYRWSDGGERTPREPRGAGSPGRRRARLAPVRGLRRPRRQAAHHPPDRLGAVLRPRRPLRPRGGDRVPLIADLTAGRAWATPAPSGDVPDGWVGIVEDLVRELDATLAPHPDASLALFAKASSAPCACTTCP